MAVVNRDGGGGGEVEVEVEWQWQRGGDGAGVEYTTAARIHTPANQPSYPWAWSGMVILGYKWQ